MIRRIPIYFVCITIILTGLLLTSCSTVKTGRTGGGAGTGSTPSQQEVASGLKEALSLGADRGAGELSQVNGFFGNALVKILWPPEAKKAENTLRKIGMGSLADQVILSLNRAAEDAAKEAGPILKNAIRQITFADAMDILFGGKNAATNYLKIKTYEPLQVKFRPVIQTSLDKVNATRYWSDAITAYNKVPLVEDINPDLAGYVTAKALDGLFLKIEEEERRIRENPVARVTELLKRVFGYSSGDTGR